MIKKLKSVFIVLLLAVIFTTNISAASKTLYFNNGGRGSLTAIPTSVRATGYHGDHTDWPCMSTVTATLSNGRKVTNGPISNIGQASAYINNLTGVVGAQGVVIINGERQAAIIAV